MKFLDENITATVTTAEDATGRASFTVNWRANSSADAETIYYGILYATDGGSVSVDVTDILASQRHDWDILTSEWSGTTTTITDWVGQYNMTVTFGDTTYTGTYEDVALVYRNPETLAGFSLTGQWLIQPGLTPHIPYNDNDVNYMSQLYLDMDGDEAYVTLQEFQRDEWTDTNLEVDGYDDGCYSRYYLRWIDRWGSMQQQPFDGKIVHTEDFTRTNITDATGTRRLAEVQGTTKWQLNTGWIDESEMPLYEALFVSPYAALYDTTLQIVYPVIITDKTYTKKTYKNNKVFNLTVTVEGAKQQAIRN